MTTIGLSCLFPGQARIGSLLGAVLVRRGVKLALDFLLACLAMVLASVLLRRGAPPWFDVVSFGLLAMALDIAFKFHSQHYRMAGIQEARSFLLGTWTKPLRGRGDSRPSSLIDQ